MGSANGERRCANENCGKPLPEGARADAQYCSGRCRMAAARQRATQAPAVPPAPVEDERTSAIPARQLADALAYAAGRTGTALTAGIAPDPVDLDVLATNAAALIARTLARHPDIDWSDTTVVPTVTALKLRPTPGKPSRDASASQDASAAPAPGRLPRLEDVGRLPDDLRTAAPITHWEQLAGVLGDDWVAMAKEATGADGPDADRARPGGVQPSRDASMSEAAPASRRRAAAAKKTAPVVSRPLRLTRKKALALLDTAELVKAEHYADTGTWDLVAADGTMICHLAPNYTNLRRNGWNAWPHGSTPNRSDRYPTRQAAATRGADGWLRIVTAKPRR
ncbi:hypothetical protein [Kitasatospora sp. NPDC085464]|uniref:hypothetical protein n=1 Tax=Kitasatospora sp. NPDC085464 TaxID=3364063 RepID=UPI0037CBA70F